MQYDITKLKRFESTVQCAERNLQIVRALLQKTKLSDLGKHIKDCSPYNRCQHILCSNCKREFRLQYVPKICEYIARQKSECCIYAVTLLEPLNASTTKKIDFNKLRNTLYQRLKRIFNNDVIVIGGFDIVLNTDAENNWKAFFHPHWHLIFITKLDNNEIRERLKQYYYQTEIIKRPVRVVKVTSLRRTVSYMFSPYFSKRVRFLNTQRKGRNPFYDGKEYKLKKGEIQKLAFKLKNNKVKDMLFFYGCRKYATLKKNLVNDFEFKTTQRTV